MTTFTDDFNRADGSPGANWVQVSGTWSIVSNQLSLGNAGGTIILRATGAMATSDHSAQVTIAATAAVSHGVWARGNSNISQGYLWRNDGTSWNLFSVVGGSFTSIGSYAAAAVAGDIAKVQAVGSTIKGFVNGIQRVSVTDTSVTTGTSVGIRAESTNSLRFDDFTGTDVASGATGDAAFSGAATLSASGLRATAGSAALAATAALTTSGLRATACDAAVTTTASLTADGTRNATTSANLGASATLNADGTVAISGTAALTATATLTASGQRTAVSDAALTTTAILTASGARGPTSTADLATTAVLDAAGVRNAQADIALAATAALTAQGQTARSGATALTATATLTAGGTTLSTHDDVDITVGAPYSAWIAGQPYAPAWTTRTPQADGWEVNAPW
ncbi:hypothetical protein ABZW44_22415 [Streptomyces mirabilis]|uniref:hypothetical protein n=1 Tax=Streptomyces mirabilis TaxID=68239 RepID=UPI0033B0ED23